MTLRVTFDLQPSQEPIQSQVWAGVIPGLLPKVTSTQRLVPEKFLVLEWPEHGLELEGPWASSNLDLRVGCSSLNGILPCAMGKCSKSASVMEKLRLEKTNYHGKR